MPKWQDGKRAKREDNQDGQDDQWKTPRILDPGFLIVRSLSQWIYSRFLKACVS